MAFLLLLLLGFSSSGQNKKRTESSVPATKPPLCALCSLEQKQEKSHRGGERQKKTLSLSRCSSSQRAKNKIFLYLQNIYEKVITLKKKKKKK
jgi:hypothetical protein